MEARQRVVTQKVQEYLTSKGLSQVEIAKKVGVSQAAISSILNNVGFGKTTARKWSQAFGFNVHYLLTGEGSLFAESESIKEEKDIYSREDLLAIIKDQQATIKNLSETVLSLAKSVKK